MTILALSISLSGVLQLLVVLAIVGVIAWALTLLPKPAPVKTVIYVVAVLLCLLIALNALGFLDSSVANTPVIR